MIAASLVLAGYRPAEVRFDECDRAIANKVAHAWAVAFAGGYPELEGTYPEMVDDAIEMFFLAVQDYAAWQEQQREQARFKRRRERELEQLRKESGF